MSTTVIHLQTLEMSSLVIVLGLLRSHHKMQIWALPSTPESIHLPPVMLSEWSLLNIGYFFHWFYTGFIIAHYGHYLSPI